MSVSIKITRTAKKKSGVPKGTVIRSTQTKLNGTKVSVSKSRSVNVRNVKGG